MKKTAYESPWMKLAVDAEAKAGTLTINGVIGGIDWGAESYEQAMARRQEQFQKDLKALAEAKVDSLVVEISSLGGSFSHALAMHDFLAQFPGKVTTRVVGMTGSAATILAQAGKVREISANALYLIHRASSYAYGNAMALRETIAALEVMDERMAEIYAKRAKSTPQAMTEIMDLDRGAGKWMGAARAKELGLADTIFEPMDAAACVRPSESEFRALGLPLPEANAEQTAQSGKGVPAPPEAKSTVASGPTHKQEFQAMLNPEQVKKMQALFGAEAACHAVAENLDFDAAILAAAEAQATALTAARAEIQTKAEALAKAEKDLAEAKAQLAAHAKGRTDPLAGHTQPPPADPDAEAKAKADAEAKADADKRAALDAFAKNR